MKGSPTEAQKAARKRWSSTFSFPSKIRAAKRIASIRKLNELKKEFRSDPTYAAMMLERQARRSRIRYRKKKGIPLDAPLKSGPRRGLVPQ